MAKFFGNTPQFWLGLQNDYDIEEEIIHKEIELNKIKRFAMPDYSFSPFWIFILAASVFSMQGVLFNSHFLNPAIVNI